MQTFFLTTHILAGLFFVILVLMQDKGTGLSASFGGTGAVYASQRGAAKIIHTLSIIACVIFFLGALLTVVAPAPSPLEITPVSGDVSVDPDAIKVETEPAK